MKVKLAWLPAIELRDSQQRWKKITVSPAGEMLVSA